VSKEAIRVVRFCIGVFLVATTLGLVGVTGARQENNLEFEVASIKPHVSSGLGSNERSGIQEDGSQVRIENLPLSVLIAISYDLKGRDQLVGPGWLSTLSFDIIAKPPLEYKHEQLQYLVRNLLADRFKMTAHREGRRIDAFALVLAKGGPKLVESKGPRTYLTARPGLIEGKQRSIAELARALANVLSEPVANQSGLEAMYDIKLEWTPDTAEPERGPSLFTAIQEQLGLKLQSQKIAEDVIVVDHIERVPTEN
jgi:uncharacterized protein (TIGR03435 family)